MFSFFRNKIKRKIKIWEREKSTKEILPFINSDRYSIRIMAIRTLGRIGDKSAINNLLLLLNHKNKFIRKEATIAITQIDNSKYLQEIINSKETYWKKENEKSNKTESIEIDKELYGWKGRFTSNMSKLKAAKDKVNKPIHWG